MECKPSPDLCMSVDAGGNVNGFKCNADEFKFVCQCTDAATTTTPAPTTPPPAPPAPATLGPVTPPPPPAPVTTAAPAQCPPSLDLHRHRDSLKYYGTSSPTVWNNAPTECTDLYGPSAVLASISTATDFEAAVDSAAIASTSRETKFSSWVIPSTATVGCLLLLQILL